VTGQLGSASKSTRQAVVRELVARGSIASQGELAALLAERGFSVTQATVSRDIAELGLAKVSRGDRHVYVLPEDLAPPPGRTPLGRTLPDERLHRILVDVPVTIGRSGLTLVLTGTPGTASVVAQAIDDSSLEQVGTLAGDNTILVLFADDAQLRRWQERFAAITTSAALAEAYP
jgi:transcriptional regulator of arginine metabolism